MYGMSILKSDGSMWLSPDFTPQNLINKGTISGDAGSTLNTDIPVDKTCFFFVRGGKVAHVQFEQFNNGGKHALRVSAYDSHPGTITVYAFGDVVTPHSGYGIAMYNASGQMIYHGEMRPLDAEQVSVGDNFEKDMGYQCAIMPCRTGLFSVPNPSLGGYNVYMSACIAVGSKIYSRSMQVGWNTGPMQNRFSTSVLVINTAKYD